MKMENKTKLFIAVASIQAIDMILTYIVVFRMQIRLESNPLIYDPYQLMFWKSLFLLVYVALFRRQDRKTFEPVSYIVIGMTMFCVLLSVVSLL